MGFFVFKKVVYVKNNTYLCETNEKMFFDILEKCLGGGIGRHDGLKIHWTLRSCGFKSRSEYKKNKNKFGRLKKITYLCRRINGGRKFRDESPTPVRKEKVL